MFSDIIWSLILDCPRKDLVDIQVERKEIKPMKKSLAQETLAFDIMSCYLLSKPKSNHLFHSQSKLFSFFPQALQDSLSQANLVSGQTAKAHSV